MVNGACWRAEVIFFIDMASLVFDQEDAEEQILAQALYVNEIDLVDDDEQERPPATGEEYLRKVVREAKKLQFAMIT